MKILITGVHGFVGSNLVGHLSAEHEIYGLDITSPQKEGIVHTFSWDDIATGNIPPVEAIIHLAGKAHDTKNQTAKEAYFEVNTKLTERIYDYFLHSSALRFLFFSTAKAAADQVADVLTEEVVPFPVGPYGESKIKAEQYLLAHPAEGRQVCILRPCMIHGPGNKGNLNLLYNVVRRGLPWPLGAFDNLRTFTSIDNLNYVVGRWLEQPIPSGIYNMGDDEPVSTNELINLICEATGHKPHVWRLPQGMVRSVAAMGGVLHLPLDKERLRKLTENYISSNAKIKRALGIEHMPVEAHEGLRRTLRSFAEGNA